MTSAHLQPQPSPSGGAVPSEEAPLVARLRAGERAAFEEVVRENSGRMYAVACRFVRNREDARDVVQDAFVSAFRNFESYHGDSRLSTWLHRIVVNAALMRLRSRGRKPEESIEPLLPKFLDDGHPVQTAQRWSDGAHEEFEREERRLLVRRAIDALPESYRTILLLRDIEEVETPEVAAILGITENAVRIRLHRARQALRTLLDPHLRRSPA
jgi:RNA polymerase sigma-70 factor (ECF subfamily)